MPNAYEVSVLEVGPADAIPGRFSDHALVEIVETLGGEVAEGQDVWEAITATFSALPRTELAERLLDAVLLQPPIPAGCEALVRRMEDPDDAPWRDHEVREDRVWLWFCHRLLHGAFPETYPAPPLLRVDLEVATTEPGIRPPGPRTPNHDRTAFVARLLAGRPGEHPLTGRADDDGADWAYDVVWAAEVTGRRRPEGAPEGVVVAMSAWIEDTWVPDLAAGAAWNASA